MEEWKDFYNIRVSNLGRVETIRKGIHYGNSHHKGYRIVSVNFNGEYKTFKVHRLVCHLFLGLDLENKQIQVNHIDNDRENNIVSNLELVTNRENCQKQKCHNEGKLVGANYHKSINKWISQIRINGKARHLGYFNTELEAHQKYMEELSKLK